MSASPILSIQGLSKRFGGLAAVDDVSLDVAEGSIAGLIGPNGAGKTTIFNLVTGVYKVSSGSIHFKGEPIHGLEPHKIVRKGITRTFQNIRLFKNLSAFDNVLTACHMAGGYGLAGALFRSKRFRADEKALRDKAAGLLDIIGLSDRADVTADNLPYGLQRRLEITRALALDPELLLLDEPAAGMNPDETEQLMRLIVDLRTRFSLSILVIEHHMDLIMGICEHIHVLNFGRTLAAGSAAEVANDPRVVEAYLGSEGDE